MVRLVRLQSDLQISIGIPNEVKKCVLHPSLVSWS
jgi:hypothetical protein